MASPSRSKSSSATGSAQAASTGGDGSAGSRTATVSSSSMSAGHAVQGKVFEAGSRQGVGGLLVTAYHVEGEAARASKADLETLLRDAVRLGSVITQPGSGDFSLSYGDLDGLVGAARTRPRVNLLVVVAAPEDEHSGGRDKVLYSSQPLRLDAAKLEQFSIALSRETLDRFSLSEGSTAKESIASYRRARLDEQQLAAGVIEFHRAEVEQETAQKEQIRRELLDVLATDPAVATIPGEVVGPDDGIQDLVEKVVERGVAKANEQITGSRGVPVNLYLTPEDRDRLDPYFDAAVNGIAVIPEKEIHPILFRSRSADNPGALLIHQNPIAKFCAEHTFEETCAQIHTGLAEEHEHDPNGDNTALGAADDGDVLTDQDISRHLARLLEAAPSPDSVLGPEFGGQRPDQATVEEAVDQFALRKGPADEPTYRDFPVLQVAFEHVWKLLIDEDLVSAGHAADKQFRRKTGSPLAGAFPRNWTDLLSAQYVYTVIPQEVPAEVAAHFDITLQEWADLSASHQGRLQEIARELVRDCPGKIKVSIPPIGTIEVLGSKLGTLSCERRRQELREQGERLIDGVRHDDYFTLHKTLRDLQDRINGNYEFTVFAADKNVQYVNFGLLSTFRLMMTPINYQVGKLVKTIPLSPKEERKYALKVTRTLKQARKEALKNNSALTHEQTSTSRAEAEIMQKAQSKTNFGLNTDGSYNLGISKGKSTTTFGVEAQQESSEGRKDFHEAVLKAVQDYKEERTVSLETEETEGSEYTESGTIVNPNDELAVTYLFYELQRRYRVSEQLYRVAPVVLVAQEVPAPHQITEAWVIAHDWILNRALLDDSFRPALQYLANKSVGDDFALRELRKNLRQQRNLVETLRIELAIASDEAENRYRALESAIEKRIGEEAAEATDGWFMDVKDFFGGDGQDPEAAKARELAAKDAHQYAVEKAEQAAAALRQEMGALHALTLEYNSTLRTHLDNETRVKRLLAHLRGNISHYMQAIWSMEPPDQRLLRLHKVQVPVVELAEVPDPETGALVPDRHYLVQVDPVDDIFASFREPGTTKHKAFMSGRLKPVTTFKPLVEVAALDSPPDYLGNCLILPLKEHNALTEFMAAPYVDAAFGAMDPDDLSNISLHDYGRYVCCLHDRLPAEEFEELKPLLRKWLELLLADPLRNGDEVTVPTDSLFIEILPGAHPLLEDFKLRHRQLDVLKVAEEVRKGRFENLRLAARLLHEEREDPDVEKKIVVEGALQPAIDVDNP
jgi:hypothetical protein